MLSLTEAVGSGAIGLTCSFVATYLHSRRKGAESLDSELRSELACANTEVEKLAAQFQLLQESPAERQARFEFDAAKAVIDRHGADCITILRHIIRRGTTTPSTLPSNMDDRAVFGLLEALTEDGILNRDDTGTAATWRIAPGMLSALQKLLY
jgi:hypothetical protein